MNVRRRRKPPTVRAAAVSLGLVLSGCGGSGTTGADTGAGAGFFDNMFGSATPATQPVAAQTPMDATGGAHESLPYCPEVEVKTGMQTIAVHAGEETPSNLRYQATIRNLARECWKSGASGTVKLGVAGRIVLGPKGQAGRYVAPLRIRVLRGGIDEVYSNVVRAPVSIAGGQGSASFSYVAERISFPLEGPGDRLTGYVVQVGFETGTRR